MRGDQDSPRDESGEERDERTDQRDDARRPRRRTEFWATATKVAIPLAWIAEEVVRHMLN